MAKVQPARANHCSDDWYVAFVIYRPKHWGLNSLLFFVSLLLISVSMVPFSFRWLIVICRFYQCEILFVLLFSFSLTPNPEWKFQDCTIFIGKRWSPENCVLVLPIWHRHHSCWWAASIDASKHTPTDRNTTNTSYNATATSKNKHVTPFPPSPRFYWWERPRFAPLHHH